MMSISKPLVAMMPAICALISSVLVFLPRVTLAQECPPVALLTGNAEACANVAQLLHSNGIETKPVDSCSHISANIARVENGYALKIENGDEAPYERKVLDEKTVAALIDSLVQSNTAGGLLFDEMSAEADSTADSGYNTPATKSGTTMAARRNTQAQARDAEPLPQSDNDEKRSSRYSEKRKSRKRFWAPLIGGAAVDFDKNLWMDAKTGICIQLGPFCVGLASRFAFNTNSANDYKSDHGDVDIRQWQLAAMLFWQFMIGHGKFMFMPGMHIGFNGAVIRATAVDAVSGENAYSGWEGGEGQLGYYLSVAYSISDKLALLLNTEMTLVPTYHVSMKVYDDYQVVTASPGGWFQLNIGIAVDL